MKPEEAIEEIHRLCCNESQWYPKGERKCKDNCMYGEDFCAFQLAIKALEEVQQYREIGTVEECREAVEKQKPKKVKIKAWNPARCPSCDYELSTNVGDGYYKHPIFLERCPQCGQKLDWSEEE